jgi:predicted Zn finger-like uncharacterized protein
MRGGPDQAMQTSCPECRTAFRVSQDQLGLRRGLVRCGKCNAVFNAYDTLLAELEEPPATTAFSGAPAHDALAGGTFPPEPSPPRVDDAILSSPFDSAASTLAGEAAAQGPVESIEPDATAGDAVTPTVGETSESILLSELPNRKAGKPALPRWQAVLYALASLSLGAGLALQSAYFLRAELVSAWPGSRPMLELLCRIPGCQVPLPRQLDKQAIAAANLEHDPEQKSRVRLTFLLVNRTGQAQAWPHVSLTLTDVREAPVARKLFPPERYLPQGALLRAGMAKGSEREVRLELDIGNLAATGFALGLVYP